MLFKNIRIYFTGILFFTLACGNTGESTEQYIEAPFNDVDSVQAIYSDIKNKQPESLQNNKENTDALALPFEELQTYLPDSVEGYFASGASKGNLVQIPGMGSWSEASIKFTANNQSLTIKIMDYNAALEALSGLKALYAIGYTTENNERKEGVINLGIEGITAYETIYKTRPASSKQVFYKYRK